MTLWGFSVISQSYLCGFVSALEKVSGGPGSGVKGSNTASLSMPKSKHISVGTRKSLLDNMDYEEGTIDVNDITHVSQNNFVPKKVQRMIANHKEIKDKPVDVLIAPGEVTICDGHHRYLMCKSLGKNKMKARIYKSRKTKEEEVK